jgi:tryptophan synthase alpha chain
VTGADRAIELDHRSLFDALATAGAPPPLLGFGISTPDHVRQGLASGAAGVISGSAVVQRMESGQPIDELRAFVAAMKSATKLASRIETR